MGSHQRMRRRAWTVGLGIVLVTTTGFAGASSVGAATPKPRSESPDSAGRRLPVVSTVQPGPLRSVVASSRSAASGLGTNALVNDPAADTQENDTQSETAVARVGTGPKLVAVFNDSGSLGTGASVHFTGYATSSDSGATWVDRGALPESDLGDVGDPSITYLAKNDSVVTATLTCGDTECGAPGYGAQIFRSSDAGVSFAAPVLADFGADAVVDKEWIAADNFPGNASSGAGNLYLMARDFGAANAMRLTRSVDGGATWSPPIAIADGGQGAYVLVGPDHSVYAFWLSDTNVLHVRRSTNQGASFGRSSSLGRLTTPGSGGDVGLAGGPRSNGFVHVAVSPTSGQLFAVYNDLSSNGDADVFLRTSTDQGATWSARRRVSTSGSGDQWMPTVAVSPDGTAALIAWYDRRNDPANSWLQRYATLGQLSGTTLTFGRDFALSPAFPVVIGQDPVVVPDYMGDYDMVAAGPADFVGTWGDNRLGNSLHAHQPDVRAARIANLPAASDLAVGGTGVSLRIGTSGTVSVRASNPGAVTVPSAAISVTLPSGLLLDGVGATSGECTTPDSKRAVTCFLGDLAPGGSVVVPLDIFALTSGTSSLRVTSTHPGTDSSPANDVASVPVTVTGTAASSSYSTSTRCAIPDADFSTLTPGFVDCPLPVADAGLLLTAVADVRIRHTFDADLQLTLVAPDGTSVPLAANVGQDGDDFGTGPDPCDTTTQYTSFDTAANAPIESGSAPFAGSFRPQGSLLDLARHHQPGIWHLIVEDFAQGDVGSVLCWRLRTTYVPEPAPTVSVTGCTATEAASCEFQIRLSTQAEWDVTVSYSTFPGTARSADYSSRSGTATLAAGATAQIVRVPLTDDDRSEPDEVFGLGLDRPLGAVRGVNAVGTIHDGTPVYRARFSDNEAAQINAAAAYFGQHADPLRFGVRLLQFLDTLNQPNGLPPISPAPTSSGPVSFIARYTQAEDATNRALATRLGLDMTALHVLGARLLQYVWFVSTH